MLPLVAAFALIAAAPQADAGVAAIGGGSLQFRSGLQAAIDSTPNGGTVNLLPGVYGELVTIRKRRGLKIVARGGPAVILHQAVDWYGWQSGAIPRPLLQIQDSADITLEHVFIRRDVRRERDPFRATTVLVTGSKGVKLERVYIGGGDGKALEVGNSEVSIRDSTLEAVQYGIAEGSSTVTISGSSIVAEQVALAVFTTGCPGRSFAVSRSLLSGRYGLAICEGDVARLENNVIVGSLGRMSEEPAGQAAMAKGNVVVAADEPVPEIAGLRRWRPEEELLTRHLEEFAVLPPRTSGVPRPGSDWFLCARAGTSDWRLFPEGPTTAQTLPIPAPLPSCAELAEAPAEDGPFRLLERRGDWLLLRPDKAYIETGPHRIEQGFWIRADRVSTPCALVSGEERVWTPLWTAGPVEAIDRKRVSIRGATHHCGTGTKTMTIEVPPSLQPATQRAFRLECTMKRSAQLCGE